VFTVRYGLSIYNSTFCTHSVFMCFVSIWEQTAIVSLYNIDWLICVTETECVYCAVRTGSSYSMYVVQVNSSPCIACHTDLHKHNPQLTAAYQRMLPFQYIPSIHPYVCQVAFSFTFPAWNMCVSVRFSPVRCISFAYWNLICFRLVFQTPSFGLATLRGRLLRDTSYLTLRTTKEGERTFNTLESSCGGATGFHSLVPFASPAQFHYNIWQSATTTSS
jgi:hypothetical protein